MPQILDVITKKGPSLHPRIDLEIDKSLKFSGKSPLPQALSAGRKALHLELKLKTY